MSVVGLLNHRIQDFKCSPLTSSRIKYHFGFVGMLQDVTVQCNTNRYVTRCNCSVIPTGTLQDVTGCQHFREEN